MDSCDQPGADMIVSIGKLLDPKAADVAAPLRLCGENSERLSLLRINLTQFDKVSTAKLKRFNSSQNKFCPVDLYCSVLFINSDNLVNAHKLILTETFEK